MKKLLLFFSILFFTEQNIVGQTPHFRNYTVDDGLPSSQVYRAFQDSKGFMWFCTDKGIARFDGYKFERFTTKNGLPNNDVWHCAEDSQQRIWFLSYANAFFYFDLKDNKFHVIENPFKELHDTYVWCYVEENGNCVKVNMGNLSTVNINTQNHKVTRTNIKYGEEYPLIKGENYLEKRGSFGIENWHLRAFSEGFAHNLLKRKHVLPPINFIKRDFWNHAVSLIFDDDKTIYSNSDSISYFQHKQFKTRLLKNLSNYPNDKLSLILNAGNRNRKLVVTEKDIFVINEHLQRVKTLDFVENFNINTIFFDSENNLWLCTKNSGLYLLSAKGMNSKVFADFSEKMSITTITKDPFNRIWFGNNLGEVFFITPNNSIHQQEFNIKKQSPIKQIITTLKKTIILWYDSSYFIYSPNKSFGRKVYLKDVGNTTPELKQEPFIKKIKKKSTDAHIFSQQGVKAIDVFSENKFILGNTLNLRILEVNKNQYKLSYIRAGKLTLKILSIHFTKPFIFVGTNKGLEMINEYQNLANFLPLKHKYPILTKPISCFAEDNQNALWTGTDGYGVYRFYNNHATEIPELKGTIINYLYSEKENNRLWIATNEGIFLLKLALKASSFTYTIQKISLAQGLPTLEVNCLVVRNNDLFVGTSKGLALLPIQNIIESGLTKSLVPLIIKNIKINRQDTTIVQQYDLNYRQNNLDIEFVALSYKSDKNIKYAYKMVSSNDNSDTIWHSVQDLHKEFSLLPPGRYEFSLRAFDIDGNATKSIKPIIFIINSPFWNTVWFKILSVLLIFSAIFLFFYLRTRNIKKKEEEKTEINKKFAELELNALQAQMNPHFVFNALSAIQNFILNNNAEEATDYLSRFSRLMRLFLESSRNKYIALSEEKVLLEYYIQLEQLRFKDKFTYQIILEENVSLDTEIPSLLLQPFVENAINHGLVYKRTNDGYLNINFRRERNKLICIIEDNGIGREKAAEIKNRSLKPYKSRGTEITKERLRSLELIESTKIDIEILDKVDENLIPQGTKVTIVMYL